MNRACTGQPVSWLRLERYHLGETDAAESRRIAEHLTACAVCAACLASIEREEAIALPPIMRRDGSAPAPRRRWSVPARAMASVLALAASAAFVLARHPGAGRGAAPGPDRVKGGDVAFALVREDGEVVAGEAGVFRDGDRFKAVVTCPPGLDAGFDLVVFDASGASFPLDPAPELACGNDVPLPGALRLTGSGTETVCVVWGRDEGVARSVVAKGAGALGDHASCKRLEPAP